jgi:hypothetical protein
MVTDARRMTCFFFFKKVWSILKRLAILGNFGGQTTEEKL